jgi:hypothetical protein
MRVRPTGYRLRDSWLRSWIIEGSPDGEHWTEIDREAETDILNGNHQGWKEAAFTIKKPMKCRCLRLTQIGKNHSGHDVLAFSRFELYGVIKLCSSKYIL